MIETLYSRYNLCGYPPPSLKYSYRALPSLIKTVSTANPIRMHGLEIEYQSRVIKVHYEYM